MIDDSRTLAVRLGKAQIEAMFGRQRVAPLDDSEFLPMMEALLMAYEDVLSDASITEELWEYALRSANLPFRPDAGTRCRRDTNPRRNG
jgi:hypothetical protein